MSSSSSSSSQTLFVLVSTILLLCCFDITNADSKSWYSLTSNFTVIQGKNKNSLAWGYFKDELFKDGWGKLYIETTSNVPDEVAFKAAGFLEGYLTWSYMYNFSQNYYYSNFNTTSYDEFPAETIDFITQNYEYTQSMANSSARSTPYWNQVSNALDQLYGLYLGYNAGINSDNYKLSLMQIYLLNLYGDIGDIITATTTPTDKFVPMSHKEVEEYMAKNGHCTTLIRLTANMSDLIVGHTTWSEYADMIRIYKRIKIPVTSTLNGYDVLFASYPGLLVSIDDYYMIKPSKLMVVETLNSILNQTLFSQITPNSFLYWIRNLVANRLATSGYEWIDNFVKYNSGTNNCQFMIVDYKLFVPSQQPPQDTLWIVEQYPGGYIASDVTFNLIEYGYWPSYNRPFSQYIFDLMGYPYYVEQYGQLFTYEDNPRANIFKKYQETVDSIDTMQWMISYNEYKSEEVLSGGYPGNAIAARYDIAATPTPPFSWFYRGPHGGIDGKAMNADAIEQMKVYARNGPTVTSDCPPFNWNQYPSTLHTGLPQEFNFTWIEINLN